MDVVLGAEHLFCILDVHKNADSNLVQVSSLHFEARRCLAQMAV